jgi:CRP/FNR family transcriptional regulator, cyclic AMP receptor protein
MDKVENIGLGTYSSDLRRTVFDVGTPRARAGERYSRSRGEYSAFDIYQWLSTPSQEAFNLASRRRHYADSSRIYTQCEPANEMFRLVSGSVRMSVLRQDGREVLYQVLEPGDCFGVCSLLDRAPRHHTTTASGEVEVQVLRREGCERLRSQDACFADALICQVSRHMRVLSEYFVSSTLDELSCRVAQRLLIAQKSEGAGGRGAPGTVRLGQAELALMVGASRQAVNRALQRFQEEGLISIEYGRVQVHDIEGLKATASAAESSIELPA